MYPDYLNEEYRRYWDFKKSLPSEINRFLENSIQRIRKIGEKPLGVSSREMYDLFKQYQLIPNELDCEQFNSQILKCGVQVPFKDIEIHDGYVNVTLDNIEVVEKWTIDDFLEWKKETLRYYSDLERKNEINSIFNKTLKQFLNNLISGKRISITTYISAENFKCLFKKDALETEETRFPSRIKTSNFFAIPISFLLDDECDGVSVLYHAVYNYVREKGHLPFSSHLYTNSFLKKILTSDSYTVRNEEWDEIKAIVNSVELDGQEKKVQQALSSSDYPEIREITAYYKERPIVRIPIWEFDDISEYTVLSFSENYNWASNYIDYGTGWSDRPLKTSTSYIGFKEKSFEIQMVPTDKKSSTFIFMIDPYEYSVKNAALALIKYFSSSIVNKRQGCKIPVALRKFGIYHMRKIK